MDNPIKTKQLGTPQHRLLFVILFGDIFIYSYHELQGVYYLVSLIILLNLHSSNAKENELTLGSYLYPTIPIVSLLYEAFSLNGSSWPNVMMHFKLKLNLF